MENLYNFLRMLNNALFSQIGYYRIILDTNINNIRAQHVYETMGFRKRAVRHHSWTNRKTVELKKG